MSWGLRTQLPPLPPLAALVRRLLVNKRSGLSSDVSAGKPRPRQATPRQATPPESHTPAKPRPCGRGNRVVYPVCSRRGRGERVPHPPRSTHGRDKGVRGLCAGDVSAGDGVSAMKCGARRLLYPVEGAGLARPAAPAWISSPPSC